MIFFELLDEMIVEAAESVEVEVHSSFILVFWVFDCVFMNEFIQSRKDFRMKMFDFLIRIDFVIMKIRFTFFEKLVKIEFRILR